MLKTKRGGGITFKNHDAYKQREFLKREKYNTAMHFALILTSLRLFKESYDN